MDSFVPPTPLDERLYRYLVAAQPPEHPALTRLREDTASLPNAEMQIAPEQGALLTVLLRLISARRTLEIGVFTGYSCMVTALAISEQGRIIACDVSEEYTAVARKHWKAAGVADKIDLRLAPAMETINGLFSRGEHGRFDFAFIDADKVGYDGYYEACLKLVRPGGLIAIDNTLWDGKPADPAVNDPDTVAIRALNAKIANDGRVDACLLPSSDGLTICRVKES
jgi:predicted O-methyltransferase YrrM